MSSLALPTELLQAILEEAASMTTSSISYQQRQKILTTCCLVSRSFLNIARPLLCSILYTASQDELDRFLEEARLSGVGGYVKVAHFVYEPGDSSSVSSLGRIAARLPALQDLRLSHGHIVLEELINLQALKRKYRNSPSIQWQWLLTRIWFSQSFEVSPSNATSLTASAAAN